MSEVLFRTASGPDAGIGHAMRARAVAESVIDLGGHARFFFDESATAEFFRSEGFAAEVATEVPEWTALPASGVWLDGYRDWSEEVDALHAAGTPSYLVENRTAARERVDRIVYPALHHEHDAWDRAHLDRILAGAPWIPLARDVVATARATERDLDLLVTFGGSDPRHTTERVLAALEGTPGRVVVAVGPHMASRREWIERLARRLPAAEVLPTGARLAPWMARSRGAVTALGTTLYELAYLGCPALIVANYSSDRDAMAYYAAHGPHRPVGVSDQLTDPALRAALEEGRGALEARDEVRIEHLGEGAPALARGLLGIDADAVSSAP